MKTVVKSLNRYSILGFYELVPEPVIKAGRGESFFPIGIVSREGNEESLLGMAVFFVNSTPNRRGYAELIYVYVIEEYRRQGLGMKLMEGMDDILKKSGLKFSLAVLPPSGEDGILQGISSEELKLFLIYCGYIPTEERQYLRDCALEDLFTQEDFSDAERLVKQTVNPRLIF